MANGGPVPTSYRRLLRHPGVLPLLTVSLATKLSTPVLSLALLLASVDRLGSYATAGLVLTGHALALAVCAPLGGRLVDRHGPRRALTGYLIAHTCAYALLLAMPQTPTALMIGAAALLGATTPPTAAVIRGAWPRLVPGGALPTAYATDNAINETTYIIGPLLVPVLMPALPAIGVVAAAGALLIAGTGVLPAFTAVRTAAPAPLLEPTSATRLGSLAGPLTHRATLTVLTLAAFGTFTFGCLRIATVAAATRSGSASTSGILMGLLSAGALTGAFAYGARTWPITGKRLLILLSLADAAAMLAVAHTRGLLALAALITLTGLLTGPRDALHPVLLAEQTPDRYRTEVFAWLNTFMWTGYGLGTAIAGHLTGPHDTGARAFTFATLVALLGAALATTYRPISAGPSTPAPTGRTPVAHQDDRG